ncbi:EVE domain-containing protein [Candidatus Alkanophaga liquidiphilum]|nr:putative RNA-binding protein [Candidatus Alkanophaga liquidiphilum]RLG37139.1 MAG: EVE domain-containing protein [Candidatus Alkanophagales archaeon]
MRYWLCIADEANWEVIRKKNIWGVSERHKNTISRVRLGDKLLIYLKQEKVDDEIRESRVAGIYEAASSVFKDATRIFKTPKGMGDETFPYRIKLKPLKVFKKPVGFKPLIPKLKFVKNKRKWSGHLMGKAMREIPEEDFKLIASGK